MKKLLLLSISLIFSNISLAQVIQARVLDIEPMNLAKMKSAVAEKQNYTTPKKELQDFQHLKFYLVLMRIIYGEYNMETR